MSVLKKLVCKRVRSDDGGCGESRIARDTSMPPRDDNAFSVKALYLDQSQAQMLTTRRTRSSCRSLHGQFSAKETIAANIQLQMEELDTFAKMANDRFGKSIAVTKLEEGQGSVPETTDHDYIVKQIQKSLSLRPERDHDGRKDSSLGNLLKKQLTLQRFRIGRNRTKSTKNANPVASNKITRNGCERNTDAHSKNSSNNIIAANDISRKYSEPSCNDSTLLYGLHRGKALEQRDDLNGKRDITEIRPKSLRRTELETKLNGEAGGAKRARFADELEQRYSLPPSPYMEKQGDAPSRFLAYNPNGKVGKSILRPSTPLNCRYYMSTDTEAKCVYDDEEEEEAFDWENEGQVSTIVSDDQSDTSSGLSLDELSHTSLGSVELLFNFLFCSSVDSLSRSDWLR